jgi:hypothetical protein
MTYSLLQSSPLGMQEGYLNNVFDVLDVHCHLCILIGDGRLGLLHLEGNNLKQQELREQESKASVSPLSGTVQLKIDNSEMNGLTIQLSN